MKTLNTNTRTLSSELKHYGIIAVTSVLYSLTFDWFYIPNDLSFGGVTGLSQIINYYLPFVPVGVMSTLFNVPLFLIGFKRFGFAFLCRSLFAMLATNTLIDAFNALWTFAPMEPMLACVCGGALMGISSGIFFLEEATGGGTELGAWIIKDKVKNLSLGRICLIADLTVIIACAAVFGTYLNALYGGIAMYLSTSVVDRIVYRSDSEKIAYVISREYERIRERLLQQNIESAVLSASDSRMGEDGRILFSIVRKNELSLFKRLIHETDPQAQLILCKTNEILGKGFRDFPAEPPEEAEKAPKNE